MVAERADAKWHRGLRIAGQVEPRRVGTAHDGGHWRQSGVFELILLEEGVEAAELADMGQLNPGIS